MPDKIVIIGASGWVGRAAVAAAQRVSMPVVGVGRSMPRNCSICFVEGDITDDEFVLSAALPQFQGAAAVVHCAGLAHVMTETRDGMRRLDEVNRLGTQRVLEFARRAHVKRVVYASSIAFYDWETAGPHKESSPIQARSAYAVSKLAGERLCIDCGLDVRIARLATVFGAGDRANFARLAGALARRRFIIPGRGLAKKSVLPCELAGELLVELARRPDLNRILVNLALPEAPSLSQLCDAFTESCGFRRAPRLPISVMRVLARFGDAVRMLRADFPLTSDTLRKLTVSTEVDVARMLKLWPDRHWPTARDTIRESSAFYRSNFIP